MKSEKTYIRARLQGTLTAGSALHIGSGEAKTHEKIVKKDKVPEKITYSALALDAQGKPYLAAASLRGFLAQSCVDETTRRSLFGYAEQESALAGALRIYDARLRTSANLPPHKPTEYSALRSHVSINPLTGTAQDHLLFSLEYVPAGSIFDLCVELDCVDELDLQAVLGLLECWDNGPLAAIGSGTGKGYGRLTWNLEKIEVMEQADLRAWLTGKNDSMWRVLPKHPAASKPHRKPDTLIKFTLTPQGPFLLNDRAYVEPKEADETPKLEFSRAPDGRALIPGTALRGWLRARARRILVTLRVAQNQTPEKADAMLETLFGSTKERGLLNFSDALADAPPTEHQQMFNAIDRFTGGVANGKLYQTRAVACGPLCGEAWITPGKTLEDWHQGLLLLLARDLKEGDLVLGWGKGRGYGAFACALEISEKSPAQKPNDWLKALRDWSAQP